MIEKKLQAIVLAAGKSSRFRTGKTKLLEKICGQEMILYTTKLFQQLSIPTTVVVGYQKDSIKETITAQHGNTVGFVTQTEQLGTGHAIACTQDTWIQDHVLVMNGDVPLTTQKTIKDLYQKHTETDADITFVTAHNMDPSLAGYGRVITQDKHVEIIEAKHFKGDPSQHCCINAGIYIVKKVFLANYIKDVQKNDKTEEFYITDLVKMASEKGYTVSTITAPFDRIRGINTFQELWIAEQIQRAELIKHWMDRGVQFAVAQNVHIDLNVKIGAGSRIGCGVHLIGNTVIGKDCDVHEFSSVENSTLEDNACVYSHTLVKDSYLETHAQVGPFAHVREKAHIGKNAVVGNFVEVKKSTVGANTKAKHLTYLGDAEVGANVNVGAGTITCNHDGTKKHKTTIKDGAYIGSNSTLVAPVTVEKKAFTAAGSVITQDVPENALALGRARQVNKEGYAQKLLKRTTTETTTCTGTTTTQDDTSMSFVGAVKTDGTTTTLDQ